MSGVKVTNMKVFVVSLTPNTDRPFVFVKLETDAGVVGWGDGTLEGKAQVVAACINDFRAFIIGADPMQVEHHWQSLYVHTFHRGGPVISAAISGLDEALWDIRGKILGLPVYKMLGGPYDPQGVRGYIGVGGNPEQLRKLRESNTNLGVTCVKSGLPSYLGWIETHAKIDQAVRQMQRLREALGPDIDIAVDFHGRTSPSVASVIIKAVEPLGLLFVEEPIPPENVKALAKISRRTSTPIATGERAGVALCLPGADRDGRRGRSAAGHQSRRRDHGDVEAGHDGVCVGHHDLAPRRCGPDRQDCFAACGFRYSKFSGPGRRACQRHQHSGRVVRIPGHAHGERQMSPAGEARTWI